MAEQTTEGVSNPAYVSDVNNEAPVKTRPIGVVRPKPQDPANHAAADDKKKVVEQDEEGGRDRDSSCGWCLIRPRCLQCCNNAIGFLVFLCIFGFVQGMTVNGMVYVVTTTLERRFNIPSVRSGFISSCYDFGVLVVVAFVTYLGEKAHKPVWLGVGALFFSAGSILFTVPHYATGLYQFHTVDIPTCDLNSTSSAGSGELESGLSRYFIVFIIAQLIHGISASGLYTLGYTYLDENLPTNRASIYVGIFQASSLFGPACGYLIGGAILEVYTDVDVIDTSTLQIDSSSPLWIGAWWIGFIITASIAFLVAFPLMAFPRSLPGKAKAAATHVYESQKGAEFTRRSGFKNKVVDFPRAICCLIRNPSFMFVSLAAITEWFLLTSFATFGPKYLETQFSMTASDAALLSGYIIIPGSLAGTVIGGVIVSQCKLHVRGMLRFALICLSISVCMIPSFIISCDVPEIAGVTVQYGNGSLLFGGDDPVLLSACNYNCSCGTAFDPVCGSDGVLYYTPCHAGCQEINMTSAVTSYYNCSCIEMSRPVGAPSTAVTGKCKQTCSLRFLFILAFFILLAFTLMSTVPVTMATMRIVSHDQRTFALGFQSVLFRAFGTVPSPVVFGALIDRTCILWERDNSGGQQCWQYDNVAFSTTSLILALVLRCCSLISLTLCLCLYKPGASVESGEKAAVTSENGGKNFGLEEEGEDTKL